MRDVNLLTSNGVNVEKALELFGDMDMYDATMSDFLEMVDQKLSNLRKYRETGDMPNYAIKVHAMKSNARSFGFMKLGDICYAHEMASKANDINYVNEHYDELLKNIEETKQIISNYKNL